MSERLLEADFLTINLKAIKQKTATNNNATPTNEQPTTKTAETNNDVTATQAQDLPAKEDWIAWGEVLKKRLEDNKNMSPEARKTDYEIETEFFEEFFTTNWDDTCAKQLLTICKPLRSGEPLRRAFKVLGFNERVNPILGFLILPEVKELLREKLLNINSFKAIFNAVAKKLIAHSEFFEANSYNIIYCKDLYTKTPKEMEAYLTLQSKILKVSASTYSVDIQTKNKKVFLYIETISELEPSKRAKKINEPGTVAVETVEGAILNSLDLAQAINGAKEVERVPLDTVGQDKIINQVKDSPAKIFATLLSLSLSTDNEKARKALSNALFNGLGATKVAEATQWLAANKIIAKGQLQDSDANNLVDKLLALIAES